MEKLVKGEAAVGVQAEAAAGQASQGIGKISATTSRKSSISELGFPVSGSRTWRWTIVAPASCAPTAESIISSGVIGIASLCPGTVIPPVIAALIMNFSMPAPFCRVLTQY